MFVVCFEKHTLFGEHIGSFLKHQALQKIFQLIDFTFTFN